MNCRVVSLNNLAGFLVVLVFGVTLASSTFAQGTTPSGPPPGAGPPANKNANLEDRMRQAKEGRLRSAELDAAVDSENAKRVQAAIVNMKEDFTRIQVLRNDIARNLVARKPFEYKLISEQTAEINKRAGRLNVYMLARVPDEKEQNLSPEIKSEEMISSLVKLCKLIDSFTENPALKNANTVEVKEIGKAREDKTKADRDLLAIIKLSGSIHKQSDSLRTPE
jgi:hypothetical protein